PIGKRDGRRSSAERGGQPVHEARPKRPRSRARAGRWQPSLNAVLRLEVAAAHVLRTGEGHEGGLASLPKRVDALLQRRVQSPADRLSRLGEWKRRVRVARIGSGQRQRRSRLVVERAAHGDDDVGGVVAATQEHQQKLRPGGAGGRVGAGYDGRKPPHRAGDAGHRELEHGASLHDALRPTARSVSAASTRARPAAPYSTPAERPSARAPRASGYRAWTRSPRRTIGWSASGTRCVAPADCPRY